MPLPIRDLCQSLTDFVERAVGIRPDFTPETLPLVDHYAKLTRESLSERPEVLDLAAQGLGAYFGEVVRRHLAGFWVVPSPNFHDWLVCGRAAFVAINPIGVGYEALVFGGESPGPSSQLRLASKDREFVELRLKSLPEVPEEEFFSLATRFDVLHIVYDAVLGKAESEGLGEASYELEDYGFSTAILED